MRSRKMLAKAAAVVIAGAFGLGLIALRPAMGQTTTTSTTSNVVTAGRFIFRPPVNIPIAGKASSAVAGGLRPGGPLDIVTGNADGTVSVLRNDGKGSFAKPVSYVASTSYKVVGLALADLNGDGKLDVAAAVADPGGRQGIASFFGQGDGLLRAPTYSPTTTPSAYQDTPLSIAAGPFTGTSATDVAVGFAPGGANGAVVRIYPGLGNGRFGAASSTLGVANTYGSVNHLVAAPLGRDGAEGLIAANVQCGYNGGSIEVFLVKGRAGLTSTASGTTCPVNTAAADVNGDGVTDIVVATGHVLQNGRQGTLWFGKGDGTYPKTGTVDLGPNPAIVAVADLTGDGKPDIVAAEGGTLRLAAGLGQGRFAPPVLVADGNVNALLITADVNGDGSLDIVAVGNDLTLVVNLRRPDRGTLSTIASSLATPGEAFRSIKRVAVGGAISLGALFFLTFPAELFNETFEANYAEISAWWQPRLTRIRRLERASPRAVGPERDTQGAASKMDRISFFAVFLAGGLLGGLLDPHFGFSLSSVETFIAVTLASAFGMARSGLVTAGYHRIRFGEAVWKSHALPAGLAVAAAGVAVSRVSNFQPGYLYGIVCGVVFVRKLATHESGHVITLTTLTTLIVGVGAWFAWLPLHTGAARPGAFLGEVITVDFLACVFVGGLVGSALSMFPLRFLAGSKLRAWRGDVWAALFAMSMFGVIQILLLSHGKTAPKTKVPLVATVALFVLFGGGSLAFRQFFVRRGRAETRGEVTSA